MSQPIKTNREHIRRYSDAELASEEAALRHLLSRVSQEYDDRRETIQLVLRQLEEVRNEQSNRKGE